MRKVTLADLVLPAERLDPPVLDTTLRWLVHELAPGPACVVSRQRESQPATTPAQRWSATSTGARDCATERVVSRGWRRYGLCEKEPQP